MSNPTQRCNAEVHNIDRHGTRTVMYSCDLHWLHRLDHHDPASDSGWHLDSAGNIVIRAAWVQS